MNKHNTGLTLIELMVTLAVAIILLSAGIPLMQGFIAKNRSTTEANALVSALNLARSEAVKSGAPVTVCPVDDPAAENPGCGTGDVLNWTNGFLVFLDENGNRTVDSSDQRVRRWDPLHVETVFAEAPTAVQFLATGEAASAEEFELRSGESSPERCVSVNAVGQIQTEPKACE